MRSPATVHVPLVGTLAVHIFVPLFALKAKVPPKIARMAIDVNMIFTLFITIGAFLIKKLNFELMIAYSFIVVFGGPTFTAETLAQLGPHRTLASSDILHYIGKIKML